MTELINYSLEELKKQPELIKEIVNAAKNSLGDAKRDLGVSEWVVYKARYLAGEHVPPTVKSNLEKQLKLGKVTTNIQPIRVRRRSGGCAICGIEVENLPRHVHEKHKEITYKTRSQGHMNCSACDKKIENTASLVAHYLAYHKNILHVKTNMPNNTVDLSSEQILNAIRYMLDKIKELTNCQQELSELQGRYKSLMELFIKTRQERDDAVAKNKRLIEAQIAPFSVKINQDILNTYNDKNR